MSTQFRSEMLTFSLGQSVFSLGVTRQDRSPFYDPDDETIPRNRARTRAAVDALWSEVLEGERLDEQTVVFDLAPWTKPEDVGASPALQALRNGRKLTLQGGRRESYPLTDARVAIDWLIACRQAGDLKPR